MNDGSADGRTDLRTTSMLNLHGDLGATQIWFRG